MQISREQLIQVIGEELPMGAGNESLEQIHFDELSKAFGSQSSRTQRLYDHVCSFLRGKVAAIPRDAWISEKEIKEIATVVGTDAFRVEEIKPSETELKTLIDFIEKTVLDAAQSKIANIHQRAEEQSKTRRPGGI
jgi:hypothetical protein